MTKFLQVKYLPLWFPGAGFKRQAAEWKPFVDEMFIKPVRDIIVATVSNIERFVYD